MPYAEAIWWTRDQKIAILGQDITNEEIIILHCSVEQLKQDSRYLQSILAVLALPEHYEGDPGIHLSRAFEEIHNWLLCRKSNIAQSEATIANLRNEEVNAEDGTPEKEDPPLAPLLQYTVDATSALGEKIYTMRKEEIINYLKTHWDPETLGTHSANKLEIMATMVRPIEAQRGRRPKLKP